MSTFAEYAALARQLAEQRRETDQDAAAEAARKRALHTALDQLTGRLTAQSHRLAQLGRAINLPVPALTTPAAPTPAASASTAAAPTAPGPTAPGPPIPGSTVAGPNVAAPAAAAPGRPGVGPYPSGAPGGAVVALPAAAGVPAPRAGDVDPAGELAEAQRLTDETDRLVQVTEAVARHPPLLPTWSPLARALAVYAGCAVAGVLLALVMLSVGGIAVNPAALYAATCAGLPVLSFVAGYLALGRWGRPALGADAPPPRFVPLGFVTCGLLLPLAQCGYLALSRLMP
ncbi:hypothetical protein [Micromonospora okii]|uniref:hypothetical protein n=1 Tax=Micromonospora okii TaxID=1182970 RepID=UPI001E2FA177|nr:hypothetical protein [Micromonospora okii]